jgi:hypothetical protein
MDNLEVWVKGNLLRGIEPFSDKGMVDLRLVYGKSDLLSSDWNGSGLDSTKVLAILGNSGRELWRTDLSLERAKTIIKGFRESAKKAGFTKKGRF